MKNELEKMKIEVAGFMRRLYQQRLTTTSGGNISVRFGEKILITPSGTDKGLLKAEEVGIMNIEGRIVGASFKPSIEI
jgi:L-fuculose-phosphate aldolase